VSPPLCIRALTLALLLTQGGGAWRFRFAAVPYFAADAAGLTAAARGGAAYGRDGLHFLHREATYALGASPLALAWKDAACSPYAVDTDAAGVVPPRQPLVLRLVAAPGGGALATGDEPPVVLAQLTQLAPPSDADAARDVAAARPGALLRFDLGEGGLALDAAGRLVGAHLLPRGAAGRRGEADSCSKARGARSGRGRASCADAMRCAACARCFCSPSDHVPVQRAQRAARAGGAAGRG
jgi:hypothetical protein